MIRSMTGFGKSSVNNELGQFFFEIKTWNSRFLDINIKLPGYISQFEFTIAELVKEKLSRGKIDVYIKWEQAKNVLPKFDVNINALSGLTKMINSFQEENKTSFNVDIASLLQIPGMTVTVSTELDEEKFRATFKEGMYAALDNVISTRRAEGEKLVNCLQTYLDQIDANSETIKLVKKEVLERYRDKLKERVTSLLGANELNLDEGRLEAEVMFYADRCDISEELTRLEAHIESFRHYLKGESINPIGKSLDFLCQELLRETNTIGSKAKDTEIINSVLQMKGEIEKIREQIQNIE